MNVLSGFRWIYMTWRCYILSNEITISIGCIQGFYPVFPFGIRVEMMRDASRSGNSLEVSRTNDAAFTTGLSKILLKNFASQLEESCNPLHLYKNHRPLNLFPRNHVFLCASFFRNAWRHFPNIQSQWIIVMTVITIFWNWNSGHLLPVDW